MKKLRIFNRFCLRGKSWNRGRV